MQAAGAVLTAVMNSWTSCACGWLLPALLALLVLWLACLPAGLIVLVGLRLRRSIAAGGIRFSRPITGGAWTVYSSSILCARGNPVRFARPAVVHALLRSSLGIGGAVCGLMGLRSATAGDVIPAVALVASASVLSFFAARLDNRIGRRVVVAMANVLAAMLRPPRHFVIDRRTQAVSCEQEPQARDLRLKRNGGMHKLTKRGGNARSLKAAKRADLNITNELHVDNEDLQQRGARLRLRNSYDAVSASAGSPPGGPLGSGQLIGAGRWERQESAKGGTVLCALAFMQVVGLRFTTTHD